MPENNVIKCTNPQRGDRYVENILYRMYETMRDRNYQYDDSVIDTLPVDDWLSQIVIKSHRAQLASDNDKLKDELIDTANYCVLLLQKIAFMEEEAKQDLFNTLLRTGKSVDDARVIVWPKGD